MEKHATRMSSTPSYLKRFDVAELGSKMLTAVRTSKQTTRLVDGVTCSSTTEGLVQLQLQCRALFAGLLASAYFLRANKSCLLASWLNYRSGAWRWENSRVALDENWNLLGDVLDRNLDE